MIIIKTNFTQLLKSKMASLDIKQADLAEMMGIKTPQLSRKIKAEYFILEEMISIADLLKADIIIDSTKRDGDTLLVDWNERTGERVDREYIDKIRKERKAADAEKRESKKAEKEKDIRSALKEKGLTQSDIDSVIADINKTE